MTKETGVSGRRVRGQQARRRCVQQKQGGCLTHLTPRTCAEPNRASSTKVSGRQSSSYTRAGAISTPWLQRRWSNDQPTWTRNDLGHQGAAGRREREVLAPFYRVPSNGDNQEDSLSYSSCYTCGIVTRERSKRKQCLGLFVPLIPHFYSLCVIEPQVQPHIHQTGSAGS